MNSGSRRYKPAPEAFASVSRGWLERADELMPVRHLLAAHAGFPARFDRAVRQVRSAGGGALSPVQAELHFRHALRLQIDPGRLTHRLADNLFDGDHVRRTDDLFLDGGDWSDVLFPLTESPVHGEILDICRTRHDFRKTSRYRWLVKRIEGGEARVRSGVRLTTIAELDAYFMYYLDLIESIERSGVVPRHRVRGAHHTGRAHRGTRSFWRDLIERDIGVAIGAEGVLVRHTSGRHRVAAAIGLGLPRIPVEVRMVHADWLTEQSERRGLPPSLALPAAIADLAAVIP